MLSRAQITFAINVHTLLELSLKAKFCLFVDLVNVDVARWTVDEYVRLRAADEGVQMACFIFERSDLFLAVLLVLKDSLLVTFEIKRLC